MGTMILGAKQDDGKHCAANMSYWANVMGFIIILMVCFLKDSGKMMFNMVKVLKFGQME